MLSCAIDAKENRYVVVSDIPGAFLHADMEDTVYMLLEGTVAEMIVKLEPVVKVGDLSLLPPIPFLISGGRADYPSSLFDDRKQ